MDQNTNTNTGGTVEKTFTQEQVNAIVGERLAKEKAKADAALADREKQLAKREAMFAAKEKITAMGLPLELLEALDYSDDAALDKALNAVQQAIASKSGKRIVDVVELPKGANFDTDDVNIKLREAMGLSPK